MNLEDILKNTFYFSVGATAVGIETVARASKALTQKGALIVRESKENFLDFCAKTDFSSLFDSSTVQTTHKDRKD